MKYIFSLDDVKRLLIEHIRTLQRAVQVNGGGVASMSLTVEFRKDEFIVTEIPASPQKKSLVEEPPLRHILMDELTQNQMIQQRLMTPPGNVLYGQEGSGLGGIQAEPPNSAAPRIQYGISREGISMYTPEGIYGPATPAPAERE